MTLTTRTKEAFKTALAVVLAYGIALSMDWEKPMWAAFAVAFISLATVGQSLHKGALRMLGTLAAMVVSLTRMGPRGFFSRSGPVSTRLNTRVSSMRRDWILQSVRGHFCR